MNIYAKRRYAAGYLLVRRTYKIQHNSQSPPLRKSHDLQSSRVTPEDAWVHGVPVIAHLEWGATVQKSNSNRRLVRRNERSWKGREKLTSVWRESRMTVILKKYKEKYTKCAWIHQSGVPNYNISTRNWETCHALTRTMNSRPSSARNDMNYS